MRSGRLVESLRASGPLWTASLALDRVLPYPVLRHWPDRRVGADDLERQVLDVLVSWGMTNEYGSATARHMVDTDLRGVDSHGVSTLLGYHRLLRAGNLEPRPEVRTVSRDGATAVVDGGGGLGHVPAETGMRLAIELARETGTGAVAVRNSGHFGAAGIYSAMAAEEGLIGMAFTDTREPAVVAARSAEPTLGTNPIAFAAPGGEGPAFELDMATSTASLGRALGEWRRGRRLPRGWAVREDGRPDRDGRRASEAGRLTPLGGTAATSDHKGYGLAAMVEILCGVLPGPGVVGHFLLALDPARFGPAGELQAGVDELSAELRGTRPLDPVRPVLVPGDPERAARAERERLGIPLSRSVFEDVRLVARASGVPFRLDAP